jgi:hypothetical protein
MLLGQGVLLAAEERKPETKPRTALAAWDTGKPSDKPLSPAALAERKDWTPIALNETLDAFKGDAVLSNGRVLAVVRKSGADVEVYSQGTEAAAERFQLLLLATDGEPAVRLAKAALKASPLPAVVTPDGT